MCRLGGDSADAWSYVDPADAGARITVAKDDPDRLQKEPQVKRGGPRFGDATNGNCKQQMTVSDK